MNPLQYSSLSQRPVITQTGAADHVLVLTADGVRRLPSGRHLTVTEDDTPTAINSVILADNSAVLLTGHLIAFDDNGDTQTWQFVAHARRGANAAATELVTPAVVNDLSSTTGGSSWTLAIATDTINGAVVFTVTGEDAKDIRWSSQLTSIMVS